MILTIDPSIATTGVAVWHDKPVTGDDIMGRLYCTETLRTQPGDGTDLERCLLLAEQVRELLESYDPTHVYIEMPPTWHARRERGNRRHRRPENLHQLNRAIGAIAVAAARTATEDMPSTSVHEVPAPTKPKRARREIVDRLLKAAGKEPSTNEHEADAIWIGIVALAS